MERGREGGKKDKEREGEGGRGREGRREREKERKIFYRWDFNQSPYEMLILQGGSFSHEATMLLL